MHEVAGEFNIYVKHPWLSDEWFSSDLDNRVRTRVRCLAVQLHERGKPCVITDVFRDDPQSVHAYGRGVDVRLALPMDEAEQVRAWMNRAFPYDRLRPWLNTVPTLDHGTAPHYHVQVKGR